MRQVVVVEPGGPEVLTLQEAEQPDPGLNPLKFLKMPLLPRYTEQEDLMG